MEGLRAALGYDTSSGTEDGTVWTLPAQSRAEAAAALATFDGAVVEDGLAHALMDPDARVRATALDRISQRENPVAVEALLEGIILWSYSDDYEALEKALATLVGWAPPGIAYTYVSMLLAPEAPDLDDRHEDIFGALVGADPAGEAAETQIAEQLVTWLDEPNTPAQTERIHKMLGWLGDSGADAVLRRLESGTAGAAVVRAAGSVHDSRAVEPLIAMLGSSDVPTRAAGAAALGDLNDTRAVQALTAATQDPSHVVRAAASEALNTMGVAAVIVGVATVMRETLRELGTGEGAASAAPETLPPSAGNSLPPPEAAPEAPPTWAQEALARFLKRAGGG